MQISAAQQQAALSFPSTLSNSGAGQRLPWTGVPGFVLANPEMDNVSGFKSLFYKLLEK
jgi:hypothetical protein